MRSLIAVCVMAVLVVGLSTGTAAAASGQVPNATLTQMGLDSMTPVSDQQGEQIRGKGFNIYVGTVAVNVVVITAPLYNFGIHQTIVIVSGGGRH